MTIGEDRVRVKFNPSSNTVVDEIKQSAAEFIDLCEMLRGSGNGEKDRCISLAQTHAEDAAMWAVKAATG